MFFFFVSNKDICDLWSEANKSSALVFLIVRKMSFYSFRLSTIKKKKKLFNDVLFFILFTHHFVSSWFDMAALLENLVLVAVESTVPYTRFDNVASLQ